MKPFTMSLCLILVALNRLAGLDTPLSVVNIILRGGKKHRATTVASLTWLWDIRATDRMIKRKLSKYYERKMRSDKVEYITVDDV